MNEINVITAFSLLSRLQTSLQKNQHAEEYKLQNKQKATVFAAETYAFREAYHLERTNQASLLAADTALIVEKNHVVETEDALRLAAEMAVIREAYHLEKAARSQQIATDAALVVQQLHSLITEDTKKLEVETALRREVYYLEESKKAFEVAAHIQLENVTNLMKTQNDEIKSLLGNVAHDVMTPAQAHTHSMNNLLSILTSLSQSAELKDNTNLLAAAFQEIKLMENCDDFMMMAINRSLDFVKCSSGITLQARMETVNVSEIINWSTECVCNGPLDVADIKCVFTDKQWLREICFVCYRMQ